MGVTGVLQHMWKKLTQVFSVSRAELRDETPVTWANQTSVACSLSLLEATLAASIFKYLNLHIGTRVWQELVEFS